ncbi:TPA: hypothetical protein ACSP3N_000540 [Aeromonas veronii]
MTLPQWRAWYARSTTIGSTDRQGNQKLPRLVSVATGRTARQPALHLPVMGWSDSPNDGLNGSFKCVPLLTVDFIFIENHMVSFWHGHCYLWFHTASIFVVSNRACQVAYQ